MIKQYALMIAAAVLLTGSQSAQAVLFGTGANQFEMSFVDIGDAGNAASVNTGYGAVGYNYRIATYEVTIDQFTKVRAMDGNVGDGDENYWSSVGTNAPAVRISWNGAAGFCNWMTSGDANQGVYQFDGSGNLTNVMSRTAAVAAYGKVYAMPTEDEWYKAAYYNMVGGNYTLYANGTAVAPGTSEARYSGSDPWIAGSGAQEQNGTFDMMGNVWEWCESAFDGNLDSMTEDRVLRGGSYADGAGPLAATSRSYLHPSDQSSYGVGFRVVEIVPEPAVAGLLTVSGILLIGIRRFLGLKAGETKEFTLSSGTDPF